MNHLSLFSGIGGIDLAAEWAGMRTVAFVEQNKFCQQVLAKHWPGVPIHDDVRTVGAKDFAEPIHVISGGFPCQPFSRASSGKRKGKDDDRYLWPAMCRVIAETKPTWVVGENVAGLDELALGDVVSDLESCGYEVGPPLEIPACAIGFDHWRARIWILAHANTNSEPSGSVYEETPVLQWSCGYTASMGGSNGVPTRMDRLRLQALGNAVNPYQAYPIMKAIAEIGI